MTLTIIVPEAVIDDSYMIELAGAFQRRSASNELHKLGSIYTFNSMGEERFNQGAYDLCHTKGCLINGGTFFVVVDEKKLNENVPETFPDRVNEDESIRTWKEYSISVDALVDGSYRMRCLHFPAGSTVSQNGLTDEERRLWEAEFGGLLVKAEGLALKTKEEETIDPIINEIIK